MSWSRWPQELQFRRVLSCPCGATQPPRISRGVQCTPPLKRAWRSITLKKGSKTPPWMLPRTSSCLTARRSPTSTSTAQCSFMWPPSAVRNLKPLPKDIIFLPCRGGAGRSGRGRGYLGARQRGLVPQADIDKIDSDHYKICCHCSTRVVFIHIMP